MSGSHTAGPWAVSKNSSGRRVTSTKGVVICNAVLRNAGSVRTGNKHGAKAEAEALANARLIAAAPALLEALETAFNRMPAPFDDRDMSASAITYRAARAAIALATPTAVESVDAPTGER